MATPKRRVLCVDDDLDTCEFVGLLFSRRGYDVTTATTPREALRLLEGGGFDLLILDFRYERMSGVELCRELRNVSSRPFLIATSQTATAAEIAAMAGAADDYLIKPYVIEALIIRIIKHLQSRV